MKTQTIYQFLIITQPN